MIDDAAIQANRATIDLIRLAYPTDERLMLAMNEWSLALDAIVEFRQWGIGRPDWPDIWRPVPIPEPHVDPPRPPEPRPEPFPGPHVGPHDGPHFDPHGRP